MNIGAQLEKEEKERIQKRCAWEKIYVNCVIDSQDVRPSQKCTDSQDPRTPELPVQILQTSEARQVKIKTQQRRRRFHTVPMFYRTPRRLQSSKQVWYNLRTVQLSIFICSPRFILHLKKAKQVQASRLANQDFSWRSSRVAIKRHLARGFAVSDQKFRRAMRLCQCSWRVEDLLARRRFEFSAALQRLRVGCFVVANFCCGGKLELATFLGDAWIR
jgi:hypothetical protein